jgi:hypothetical protein
MHEGLAARSTARPAFNSRVTTTTHVRKVSRGTTPVRTYVRASMAWTTLCRAVLSGGRSPGRACQRPRAVTGRGTGTGTGSPLSGY